MRVFPAPRRAVLTFALALAMIVMGMTVPSAAAPASAFVRVNQVGYPDDSVKRAYLMSSTAETGATFAVKNAGGTTLFSGPIGQALGSWSNAYPFVYALDFDGRDLGGDVLDRGDRAGPRHLTVLHDRHADRPSTSRRWRTRCPSTRPSATARISSPGPSEPRPRTSTTRTP